MSAEFKLYNHRSVFYSPLQSKLRQFEDLTLGVKGKACVKLRWVELSGSEDTCLRVVAPRKLSSLAAEFFNVILTNSRRWKCHQLHSKRIQTPKPWNYSLNAPFQGNYWNKSNANWIPHGNLNKINSLFCPVRPERESANQKAINVINWNSSTLHDHGITLVDCKHEWQQQHERAGEQGCPFPDLCREY